MTTVPNDTSTPRPAEHRPVDEHANLITHALGMFLSVAATAVLMTQVVNGHSRTKIVACAVYCCSLIGLYAASTFSHMFYDPAWRRFFRTLDQVFIYLLIAGSFTPFAVFFLWDRWGPSLLMVMWGLAFLGVVLVLYMRNLTPAAKVTYGLLGWLPAVSLRALLEAAPFEIFAWIVVGGVFYSAGSVFLRFDQQVRYFHALWHVFVIAGSICHYIAVLLVVT
jgi:hemolysin III